MVSHDLKTIFPGASCKIKDCLKNKFAPSGQKSITFLDLTEL